MSQSPNQNSTSASLDIDDANVDGWSEPEGEHEVDLGDNPFEYL